MAQPRELPADQLEQLGGNVVERILDRLAAYGYAPQPIPPAAVAPLPAPPPRAGAAAGAAEPTPAGDGPAGLAVVFYASGREAFFANGPNALPQATRHFSRAVEQDAQNPVYRYYLGLSLYRQGKHQEAMQQVLTGARLETNGQRRNSSDALERVQGPLRVWLENLRHSVGRRDAPVAGRDAAVPVPQAASLSRPERRTQF